MFRLNCGGVNLRDEAGYIDCICFDLKTALNAASALLNRYPFAEIGFHVFRLNCGGVNLRDEAGLPQGEEMPEEEEQR